jgi:hypothetical protein
LCSAAEVGVLLVAALEATEAERHSFLSGGDSSAGTRAMSVF